MLLIPITAIHCPSFMNKYSRAPMAQTSLGAWKFVLDIGSSSHWRLIIATGQESNGGWFKGNLGMLSVLIRVAPMRRFQWVHTTYIFMIKYESFTKMSLNICVFWGFFGVFFCGGGGWGGGYRKNFLGTQKRVRILSGSVGCAVRLESRRSRVQPPPRSATFFLGDWSWNIFYGHSLPSADSRRTVVSFWRKNVYNTG